MTIDDRSIELLAEANPVSDPHSLALELRDRPRLDAFEQWSGTMTETELRSIEPPTGPKNRRNWLVAVAALAILVVGIGAGVLISRSDEPAATETAAVPLSAEETIQRYIDAYNVRDIEAVMDFFTEGSVVTGHPAVSVAEGLAAIREIHSEVGEGDTYAISITDVSGDTVTWDHVWSGFEDSGEPFRNCVSGHRAVIQDGKIVTWEWPATNFQC